MRIHTNLKQTQVEWCLQDAKFRKRVDDSVTFTALSVHGSRTHPHAFEVQLGSPRKDSIPHGSRNAQGRLMLVRKRGNANLNFAATYDEWGWFLKNLFDLDHNAKAGPYNGATDFHEQTNGEYFA